MNHELFAHLFFGVIKAPVVLMGAPSFDPYETRMEGNAGLVGGGSQEVPVKSRLPCLGLALGNRLGEDEMLLYRCFILLGLMPGCSFSLGQTFPIET